MPKGHVTSTCSRPSSASPAPFAPPRRCPSYRPRAECSSTCLPLQGRVPRQSPSLARGTLPTSLIAWKAWRLDRAVRARSNSCKTTGGCAALVERVSGFSPSGRAAGRFAVCYSAEPQWTPVIPTCACSHSVPGKYMHVSKQPTRGGAARAMCGQRRAIAPSCRACTCTHGADHVRHYLNSAGPQRVCTKRRASAAVQASPSEASKPRASCSASSSGAAANAAPSHACLPFKHASRPRMRATTGAGSPAAATHCACTRAHS